jgi:diketogulonate reductase-like aldo/keto reductase
MTYGDAGKYTTVRCWREDGDRVRFLIHRGSPPNHATICVAYNLGSGFHSWPVSERVERVRELINLMGFAIEDAMHAMVDELKHGDVAGTSEVFDEELRQLTGENLKAKLKEIDRKYTRYSPVVQGGLPSLGKRHS